MMTLKKRRRIQVIVLAFVGLGFATAIIGYALQDGINYFRSPTQVVDTPPSESEQFRIGGLVTEDSIKVVGNASVAFTVTDGNATVPVVYVGILPDLFEEGQGMIGLGRLVDGTFQATEILAKHDENYMPVEVIEALEAQGVYRGESGELTSTQTEGADNDT
jgi:cytochrome c-type biogenesis protein CcmE